MHRHDINREFLSRSIIAHMLFCGKDTATIEKGVNLIKPYMIPEEGVKKVHEIIYDLYEQERVVDLVTVGQTFIEKYSLDRFIMIVYGTSKVKDGDLLPVKLGLDSYHSYGDFDTWLFLLLEQHYAAHLYKLLKPFMSSRETALEIMVDLSDQPRKMDTVAQALEYLLDEGGLSEFEQLDGAKELHRSLIWLREDLRKSVDKIRLLGYYNKRTSTTL